MSRATESPTSPATAVVQAIDFASPIPAGKTTTRKDVEKAWTSKPAIIYTTKERVWLVARSVGNKARGTFQLAFAESSDADDTVASFPLNVLEDVEKRKRVTSQIIYGFVGGRFRSRGLEAEVRAVPCLLLLACDVSVSGATTYRQSRSAA